MIFQDMLILQIAGLAQLWFNQRDAEHHPGLLARARVLANARMSTLADTGDSPASMM